MRTVAGSNITAGASGGAEGSVVVEAVKKEKKYMGYNVDTEEMVDMFEAGVIDPTKMARSAPAGLGGNEQTGNPRAQSLREQEPSRRNIVLLRFVPATPVEPAAILIDLFGDTPLAFPRKFTVVDSERVRQRPWPADDETVG